MVKEIGILFSEMMVQARLAGWKFVTRRDTGLGSVNEYPDLWCPDGNMFVNKIGNLVQRFKCGDQHVNCTCRYGQPGDILWVRENYQYKDINVDPKGDMFFYKASYTGLRIKWRPSIHMPKDAARIWLRVKSIRLERLHEITDFDCIREGIQPLLQSHAQFSLHGQLYRNYLKQPELFNDGLRPKRSFRSLWEFLHGVGSWKRNPWLWVIEFEPLEKHEEKFATFLNRAK